MGIFDEIGKELEKAFGHTNSNSNNLPLVKKALKIQEEYNENIQYLNQLDLRNKSGEMDQSTYESLKDEYGKNSTYLLTQITKYQTEYDEIRSKAESIINRVSFERSEISRNLGVLLEEFSKSIITEKEYKQQKNELEVKIKKLDNNLIKAKKTISQLEKVKPIFDTLKENTKTT